ncbi:PDZ domain-containing protein [Bacillus sp. T3]|uniref:PDZ domain-containing protein n=1 Tax=Bacillus sp. T3 TaxID=467262 RepID=UPI0029824A1E|nr:PDZ domain-containing protein [Bacillus sp. T3]
MAQDWLVEFLIGTGKLFLHPLFYVMFLISAYLGVSRVKRERKNFHVRVENAYFELRQLLPYGLLIGLCLSIFIVAAGVVIPFGAIVLIAAASFLFLLTTKIRFVSPAYTLGIALIAMFLIHWQNWTIPFIETKNFNGQAFPAVAILLGLLIIAEGILILWNGKKGTSPMLIKGKRGAGVGAHEVKRLWMVPLFLLIPGDVLQLPFSWWPTFAVGGETFSLLLVPFGIGIHQQIQAVLPAIAMKTHGKQVVILGVVIAFLAGGAYFMPVASIAVAMIAIVSREIIVWRLRIREQNLPFYFSKQNHGLMILGILLDSPASKMALKVGEIISKVNGQTVTDETEFYEALQRNRAHCKLEVYDVNQEVRFVQRALYEGDHHELGILFVQDEKKKDYQAG